MAINELWVEKYRPQTIEDMILNEDIKKGFTEDKLSSGNILLIGRSGIGKTSVSKIIPKILDCQYIYINASDENGIDTIRLKITKYVQTKSAFGDKKIVILDEACGLSSSAQQALRNLMEEYTSNCIFILTANEGHKIKEAIQSRCKRFDLTYGKREYAKHILSILDKEGVKYSTDIVKYIATFYPDFRRCLNDLQKMVKNGEIITPTNKSKSSDFITQLWTNIQEMGSGDLREFVITHESDFENDYSVLIKRLFDYVCFSDIEDSTKSKTLIQLGIANRYHLNVPDVEINFFTCLEQIRKEIK